jgi:diaminopimelate decarboxylase
MVRTNIDLFPISARINPKGSLSIADHDLALLTKKWGTPLYLYDGATVRWQAQRIQNLLKTNYSGSYDVTYAAKAYFSLGVARRLAQLDLGVDVVSLAELEVARKAGFAPERVHLHGNNKTEQELRAAVEWGVQSIVVDSLEELAFLERLCSQMNRTARIWFRVTPGIHVDTHAYRQTAHPASKFGLPIADGQAAEGIRRAKASSWLKLTGLHTHLGSQVFEIDPYRRAIAMLLDLAAAQDWAPEELSPGGGWGVPYTLDDPEENPVPWIEGVSSALQAECARHGWKLPKLVIEPGRMIVARAGVVVYTVGTTKTSADGTYFVAVDGGMADNPRPALYQARYTAVRVDLPNSPVTRQTALVGKFCETGDQLIPDVMLPPVERGDLVAMPVAGAYHLAMSSNYNLAGRPAVLWLEPDKVEVLQRREQPQNEGWWVTEGE